MFYILPKSLTGKPFLTPRILFLCKNRKDLTHTHTTCELLLFFQKSFRHIAVAAAAAAEETFRFKIAKMQTTYAETFSEQLYSSCR